MDFAVKSKQTLFVVYVDFSKANDRIPRDMLMETLTLLGCGGVLLVALASMYNVSHSILGMPIWTAGRGRRHRVFCSPYL